jgi:hypothetical protein
LGLGVRVRDVRVSLRVRVKLRARVKLWVIKARAWLGLGRLGDVKAREGLGRDIQWVGSWLVRILPE